ncbi:hypothetical protein H106_08512 [Trichophyton rubrum CBS 735.88]|nr:hypothetical protein H106_08512 [Trichophyton rubrum CBS 735.88]
MIVFSSPESRSDCRISIVLSTLALVSHRLSRVRRYLRLALTLRWASFFSSARVFFGLAFPLPFLLLSSSLSRTIKPLSVPLLSSSLSLSLSAVSSACPTDFPSSAVVFSPETWIFWKDAWSVTFLGSILARQEGHLTSIVPSLPCINPCAGSEILAKHSAQVL